MKNEIQTPWGIVEVKYGLDSTVPEGIIAGSKVLMAWFESPNLVHEYLSTGNGKKHKGQTRAVYHVLHEACRLAAQQRGEEITLEIRPKMGQVMTQWCNSDEHGKEVFGRWDSVDNAVGLDSYIFTKRYQP